MVNFADDNSVSFEERPISHLTVSILKNSKLLVKLQRDPLFLALYSGRLIVNALKDNKIVLYAKQRRFT